jgi:ADP-ribose pyrophosphatase YjhB (NUDIX family)
MSLPHRIAAGGIIFLDSKVLLVRYNDGRGGSFLAGPGGKLEDDENIVQAIIRETREETGVLVAPQRVVAIEDLVGSRYKMSKVWMVCEVAGGQVRATPEAEQEGIIEAGWFSRPQLAGEVVFPPFLMQQDWEQLRDEQRPVICLPSRTIAFC